MGDPPVAYLRSNPNVALLPFFPGISLLRMQSPCNKKRYNLDLLRRCCFQLSFSFSFPPGKSDCCCTEHLMAQCSAIFPKLDGNRYVRPQLGTTSLSVLKTSKE